jgi:hypothetical protein
MTDHQHTTLARRPENGNAPARPAEARPAEARQVEARQVENRIAEYRHPENRLAPKTAALLDGMSIRDIAESCANSGMFKDIRSAWQAVVKIKAGLELGIPPIQAMNGLYIIEGKVAMAATLMGGLIKASGRYTYRILQHDENGCTIQFFERGDDGAWLPAGPASSFTMADAQRAAVTGKAVWKAWPRNMLFARAMSNGARWYCADVFLGPVYVPEELGAEVNEDGEVVVMHRAESDTPSQGTNMPAAASASATPGDESPTPQPAPQGDPRPVRPANLERNDWQREAAKLIYACVTPEVAEQVRSTGGNPLFSEIEFTRYLVKVAAVHAITLPDGIRPIDAITDPDQQPLFDEDGCLTEQDEPESGKEGGHE